MILAFSLPPDAYSSLSYPFSLKVCGLLRRPGLSPVSPFTGLFPLARVVRCKRLQTPPFRFLFFRGGASPFGLAVSEQARPSCFPSFLCHADERLCFFSPLLPVLHILPSDPILRGCLCRFCGRYPYRPPYLTPPSLVIRLAPAIQVSIFLFFAARSPFPWLENLILGSMERDHSSAGCGFPSDH